MDMAPREGGFTQFFICALAWGQAISKALNILWKKKMVELIPAKLDKHSVVGNGKAFSSADEQRIMEPGSLVASCVTARYYKGLAVHGDNLVIVENV